MKLGIITDVHCNIAALNAVLEIFEKENVDKIINCGDIIGIGPYSEEAVQMLMQYKDKLISVRGNHEGYLIDGLPEVIHDDKRKMRDDEIAHHKWNHSCLSEESINFLKTFSKKQYIEINGKKICIVHYPAKKEGGYEKHYRTPTVDEVEEIFKNYDSDIYLYGHSHLYVVNKLKDKWYINVGSLGCPIGENYATAGMLEITNENVEFKQIKAKYDVQAVIDEIRKINYPMCEKIIEDFYI